MSEANQKTSLRVILDAHMVGDHATGNETYVAGLASALACLPNIECLATIKPRANLPRYWSDGQPNVAVLSPSSNWPRLLYTLPRLCRSWRADVLHVTYNGPFFNPCPVVVTVHDVIFKRYPAFFSARDRLLFATLLRLTLHRAAAIITDSESSRHDIVTFYPFTAGKIHVVPLAVNPALQVEIPDERRQAVRTRYCIDSPFILAVGNLQPRKNLQRLVQAFRGLMSQGPSDYQLVLVGKDAYQSGQFRKEVADLIASGRVILTGYVPDEDLPALYRAASVFAYLSLFEGFGLPILEAMTCGTPVVTSNVSSMPEVAGDAALLVDPTETTHIQNALYSVISQPELADQLSEQGQRRSKHFTWANTAHGVMTVYRQVLNRGNR